MGLWFTGNEVATAERFRVTVEVAAMGSDSLGRERGKLPRVTGSALVGRGMREPTCRRRSTGAPCRRGLGRSLALGLYLLTGVPREAIGVLVRWSDGFWSEGRCRGFVTVDVLVKGLSVGAIAPWWRLKWVMWGRDRDLPRFGPS